MAFFGFGKKEKDKMKTGLEKTRTGFWGSIMNTPVSYTHLTLPTN